VWQVIGIVLVAGCLGGLVNALLAGELKLPHLDVAAHVLRPGWAGNVVIGGIAALVFWALYGPFAKTPILGPAAVPKISLTLSELAGSVLTGIGGSRLLMAEVEKRALEATRNTLADALKELTSGRPDGT
jgi:hypothetical protein